MADSSRFRAPALDAVRWLLDTAVPTPAGCGWPSVPGGDVSDTLYAGTPGVLIALLEAHHVEPSDDLFDAVVAGAHHLAAMAASTDEAGLYTGIAGQGFALAAVAEVTGDEAALAGVKTCIDRLADPDHRDVTGRPRWGAGTDIIFGAAGTAWWLLQVGEFELAVAAAEDLLTRTIPAEIGRRWPYLDNDPEIMPNFSHGTAGIAAFLAAAGTSANRDDLVDAAIDGARHLLSIARVVDDTCAVYGYEPGGEDRYALGWCHGPTGLSALFECLYRATGDDEWAVWRDRCLRTVRTSGIPEREGREPGFWDNVAACCGSAGVARRFLGAHQVSGDPDHLAFAEVLADDILERATVDETGTRWSNLEFRAEQPVLPAQTGFMQGASGIVSCLLALDRHAAGDPWAIAWPGDPFAGAPT